MDLRENGNLGTQHCLFKEAVAAQLSKKFWAWEFLEPVIVVLR